MSEERSTVFGRNAATYDQFRPSYPPDAIDRMLALTPVTRALEVGAGTGKATELMARPGIDIVCLEPSPEMAELLASRRLPGVEVVLGRIEDYEPSEAMFDLVYAAQAWHWVDRDSAYQRAMRSLRPGGALALVWNLPLDRYGDFEAVYRSHAPDLLQEDDERVGRRDDHDWCVDLREAGFEDVSRFSIEWSQAVDGSELAGLHSTYSDHIMLEATRRDRLLDALADHVSAVGGSVELRYSTDVFTGIVPHDWHR